MESRASGFLVTEACTPRGVATHLDETLAQTSLPPSRAKQGIQTLPASYSAPRGGAIEAQRGSFRFQQVPAGSCWLLQVLECCGFNEFQRFSKVGSGGAVTVARNGVERFPCRALLCREHEGNQKEPEPEGTLNLEELGGTCLTKPSAICRRSVRVLPPGRRGCHPDSTWRHDSGTARRRC